MYPIFYQRKTRTGFLIALLLLALSIRVVCEPALRRAVWDRTRAVLGSETLFRAVIFLETGVLPLRREAPQASDADAERLQAETAPPPATETSPASPETEAAPAAADEAAPAPFTAEEAEAIGLRGNCSYPVDKAALLLRPLNWTFLPGPKVLIIHSHSSEAYAQSEGHSYVPSAEYRTLDPANNVIAVGDALAEALAELGVELIHDRSINDYPSYNNSYASAREKIQGYLERYPSIVMVIDLHRDAMDKPVREVAELDGQVLAPLMLAVGTDEGGLSHPHWEDNLSCGLKLQALGLREAPGLFRKLSFRKERFNMDLTPGSLIVEAGSTGNTLPEAVASMRYLARCVAELLRCE